MLGMEMHDFNGLPFGDGRSTRQSSSPSLLLTDWRNGGFTSNVEFTAERNGVQQCMGLLASCCNDQCYILGPGLVCWGMQLSRRWGTVYRGGLGALVGVNKTRCPRWGLGGRASCCVMNLEELSLQYVKATGHSQALYP
jgi:hypothetical protein